MPVKEPTKKRLADLRWLVESRNENQKCAMKLFGLLKTYPQRLRRDKYQVLAQHLVGVTFSLWRAVFLADKSGKKEETLKSAINFLEIVIADNAINYVQDKKQKEWTFNYYTNNVRFTMTNLAHDKNWPLIVPKWVVISRTPKQRWEYGQRILAQAVDNFERALSGGP